MYLLSACLDIIFAIKFDCLTPTTPTNVKYIEAALAAADFFMITNAFGITHKFDAVKYYKYVDWILFRKSALSAADNKQFFPRRIRKCIAKEGHA